MNNIKICKNCKNEYLYGLREYCTNRCKYSFYDSDKNSTKIIEYKKKIKDRVIIKKDKFILFGRDVTREKIRLRDNFTCQICGKVWIFGQRRFDVHHKDYDKEKTKSYDCYEKEKDNLITLCHKCHLNLPEHRKVMSISH